MNEPKTYRGIMVSSTFADLEEHRRTVIEAIQRHGYKANVMEDGGARADVDVIDSSLKMVRDSVAYIGVISRKYGQTPFCPERNPDRLSLTELEFNEAIRLDRPILLFIMGEKHPVTEANIELDPEKRRKLESFRARAKLMRQGSEVERVYVVFESLQQFSTASATAVGRLAQYLSQTNGDTVEDESIAVESDTTLPRPPALAAFPRYLGSHPFVGRISELQTITEWSSPADPNPMLLFEAMGGSGKSMLTWEWLTNHATRAREDWAGRFWYSFYEEGAVMSGFCRHALAYISRKPVQEFAKLHAAALAEHLIGELEKRPWLIVLDGLERVLVAYHRYDAAQLRDEDVDTAVDQIGERDPCAAIRPEDDNLLRRLAAVAPSKVLVSSRLTPLAIVNPSRMPVPGVRREVLPGLRPADAEAMIRACGATGRSEAIQAYLQTNCDCHPLVVGALAGLVKSYPLDRGNFDRWAEDPYHGGALNLGELDLARRRNHILFAAIDALAPESRQLLQTLALLRSGAAFETLEAFNPHRSSARSDLDNRTASTKLGNTIRDLEKRGLLQYDLNGKRYDLHPVVRSVVAGRMAAEETRRLGQQVVDYFTARPHNPWEQAEKIEDVASGLQIVDALLRMRLYDDALTHFNAGISTALHFNLAARAEILALLRPFFPDGWDGEPVALGDEAAKSSLLGEAAAFLGYTSSPHAKSLFARSIAIDIKISDARELCIKLQNVARHSLTDGLLADGARISLLSSALAGAIKSDALIFASKLAHFYLAISIGDRKRADGLWSEIEAMGRDWPRWGYRPGEAEGLHARYLFQQSELTERVLTEAETLTRSGRNRSVMDELHRLRGEWYLASGNPAQAVKSLSASVRMQREAGIDASLSEALLALARLRTNEAFDARGEAERLSEKIDDISLAELWQALGERERAVEQALGAHRHAVQTASHTSSDTTSIDRARYSYNWARNYPKSRVTTSRKRYRIHGRVTSAPLSTSS